MARWSESRRLPCAVAVLACLGVGAPARADEPVEPRAFAVGGEAVEGSGTASGAPTLAAGLFHDTLTGESKRTYAVRRGQGSTLRVNVAARPSSGDGSTTIQARLTTRDGQSCESDSFNASGYSRYGDSVVSGTLVVDGPQLPSDATPSPSPDACADESELLLTLSQSRGSDPPGPLPLEIFVVDEPPVKSEKGLPQPSVESPPAPVPVTPPEQATRGGGAFTDAAVLTPGTWTDSILVGEQVFYRVDLRDGQRAALTVDAPGAAETFPKLSSSDITVSTFAPDRADITLTDTPPERSMSVSGSSVKPTIGQYTPTVAYLNRSTDDDLGAVDRSDARHASQAGPYYFTVAVTRGESATQTGGPVPVRLRLAVLGKETGAPPYVRPPGQLAWGKDGPDGSVPRPGAAPIALAAAGVLCLVGAVVGVLRTRRVSRSTAPR